MSDAFNPSRRRLKERLKPEEGGTDGYPTLRKEEGTERWFLVAQGRLIALLIPGEWQTPTLLNGWANFTSGEAVRYRRVGDNVELKGVLDASSATSGLVMQFPAGYRPPVNSRRTVVIRNDQEVGNFIVGASGDVFIIGGLHGSGFIGLDGIFFNLEDV